ncbi:MAG: ribosome silencing factor [Prevotellaceae bacterium]|jgi:ribosome-associated protein|nr:ribosome silencing factor [Prevotellaceae bacterium]
MNENSILINRIVEGIQEKKGKRITVVDMSNIPNTVFSHFVICQAESSTQVHAIAESVRRYVSKTLKIKPFSTDGYENAEWIIIDYGDVLVHIFRPEAREFYRLEELWEDAVITEIADLD